MMSSHGQHAQYANYLDQERQRHQRAQMQEAQRALQQRGPNNVQYVHQHPSVHQRQQIHKKAVKNQQPNQGYGAEQMGYAPHSIPGAQNGMKPDGVNADYSRRSGRKSSSQRNNKDKIHGHPNGSRDQLQATGKKSKPRTIPSKELREYYSSSSEDEEEESSGSSSTIASTDDSDDQNRGMYESSSDESSIGTGLLKDGPNIPDIVINGNEEGNAANPGLSNPTDSETKKMKKKKKKKRKKDKDRKVDKSKKKKKKKKRSNKEKEKSVSKSKSKRKQKKKKKEEKEKER